MSSSRSPRRSGFHLLALLALTALLGACGLDPGAGARKAKVEEALEVLQAEDFEKAYYLIKEIRTEHPDSAEADAVFSHAAYCLKRLYYRDRYKDPESAFVGPEKLYMFDWLAGYFEDGQKAQRRANSLFRGAPYSVFRSFEEYAADHPAFSGWTIRAEKDNGIIQEITAERVETASR